MFPLAPPTLYRFCQRLRRQEGASALEGFFAIALMIMTIVVVVGVATVIHNQSVLNGAAQLAAQQGLVTYDRQTYRGDDPGQVAFRNSYNVAAAVAREDSQNMMASQARGDSGPGSVVLASSDYQLVCGSDFNSLSPYSCLSADPNGARAEKVTVTIHANTKLLMLDFFSFIPAVPSEVTLTAKASAVSEGPSGR